MGKRFEAGVLYPDRLRGYDAPGELQLVQVCEKCERRLRKDGRNRDIPRLKRVLQACATTSDQPIALRVLEVPCMNVCPEGGVTACTGGQATGQPARLSVIRTPDDVLKLYDSLVRSASEMAQEEAMADR